MLLHALNAYYERLAADPRSGVAPFGYSRQQIGFVVVLNADGSLHAIQDARTQDDKGKLRNRPVVVPGYDATTGSGLNPDYLRGKATYVLGCEEKSKVTAKSKKKFVAFRELHLSIEGEVKSPHYRAVCDFLRDWDPRDVPKLDVLIKPESSYGVFQIRNALGYVHEDRAFRDWFDIHFEEDTDDRTAGFGQCLVTGEHAAIARLHQPKIKNVWGGQSSGGLLASFDDTAYESYGRRKSTSAEKDRGGLNAPVSRLASHQYCTALNYLLDPGAGRRLSVGDTTVVFWTAAPTEAEAWIAELFNPSQSAEDEEQVNRVGGLLDKISRGEFPGEFGEPGTPFYVLGLSPNAARISVRFCLESTLGEFLENLGRHYRDLEIARGPKDLPHPPLWRLLRETVRDAKDIPDLLEGALLRAVLTGGDYPQMFFAALLRRIQADREVRYARAAAIKAFLRRNHELELSMALDPNRPEAAYHLGRLFAELEKTQEDALPGINDTIKDRYFGAASATPASVFPRIIRMNQHHLGKLERGSRTYHERRIQEIAGRVDGFPAHLSMRDQGLFAIGYYHQRQDIFTKKPAPEPAESAAN